LLTRKRMEYINATARARIGLNPECASDP
jgi:hypothetical protein